MNSCNRGCQLNQFLQNVVFCYYFVYHYTYDTHTFRINYVIIHTINVFIKYSRTCRMYIIFLKIKHDAYELLTEAFTS